MNCEIEYVISFVQFHMNEEQIRKDEYQNELKFKVHLKNEWLEDIKIKYTIISKWNHFLKIYFYSRFFNKSYY